MPISIKTANIKYKNSQGEYVGVNTVGEATTSQQIAAIEAKGEEVLESIPQDYSTLSDEIMNQVIISDTQPTEETNKLWIDADAEEQYTVPSYTEFSTLSETVSGKYTKPADGIPAEDIKSGVIPVVHNVPDGGTAGQVLAKASGDDYDLEWINNAAAGSIIDDTAGAGATARVWSADKSYSEGTLKQSKITASGILKGNGSGGVSAAVAGTDYIASHQDISGKADKVSSATNGNFAGLDSNGNLTDSGHKHSDYLTSHQDITGKADKVTSATSGNFAGLDGNGNLTDSGHKHSDYLTSHQDISGKADKSGTVLSTTLSMGRKANTTAGTHSTALGEDVTASGTHSFGTGHTTTASGAFAVASGYGNTASGKSSVVSGLNSSATGETSFAHGQSVTSNSSGMVAAGIFNVLATLFTDWTANTSYAIGDLVNNGGVGYRCKTANSDATFTASNWTKLYTNGDTAFVIGNGIDVASRSNAFKVDWNGNGRFKGDIYAGCSLDSTGGVKVATEVVVDTVSGSTPSITGTANHRYMCGTVSTISITPPQSGIIDVVFTSGSTAAALTIPNTVKLPDWFDATDLDTNTTYEINIMDGVYGAVMKWT